MNAFYLHVCKSLYNFVLISDGTGEPQLNSTNKHFLGVESCILEKNANSFMSPVAGMSDSGYHLCRILFFWLHHSDLRSSSDNRSNRMTPSTPRTNPFDIYDPSELTMSIVSPSVFTISKEKFKNNGWDQWLDNLCFCLLHIRHIGFWFTI